ncbi:MAG: sortase [Anaerolineae bacterium]|nr:sortase [Anaerolineae bacterium]
MKRNLRVWSIATAVTLILCAASLLPLSLTGWLIIRPETETKTMSSMRVVETTPVVFTVEKTQSSVLEKDTADRAQPVLTNIEPTPTIPRPTPTSSPTLSPSPTSTPTAAPTFNLKGITTRLVIPTLDVDRPILRSPFRNETWQVDHLGLQIGHLEGTAPAGSDSNMVLAGHVSMADGSEGPFAHLNLLAIGDTITVYEGDQEYRYVVDDFLIVDQASIEVVYPTETGQITLITCNNWNSDEGRYVNRLVVTGRLVES